MNAAVHQKKKMRRQEGGKKAKEDKRQILDSTCCNSSVGSVGRAQSIWDPQEDQQSFRPNPTESGTECRVKAAIDC